MKNTTLEIAKRKAEKLSDRYKDSRICRKSKTGKGTEVISIKVGNRKVAEILFDSKTGISIPINY